MRFLPNGWLDTLSVEHETAEPPWFEGDVIEVDQESGIGRLAINRTSNRDDLMLSPPIQLQYPRHIMEKLREEA